MLHVRVAKRPDVARIPCEVTRTIGFDGKALLRHCKVHRISRTCIFLQRTCALSCNERITGMRTASV